MPNGYMPMTKTKPKKTKPGRPRLYQFPTTRIMVTVPQARARELKSIALEMMRQALIEQEPEP